MILNSRTFNKTIAITALCNSHTAMRILTFNFCPMGIGLKAAISLAFLLFTFYSKAAVLTCPEDYSVTLPPGECGIEIYYDTVSFSSSVPLKDTVFFPLPGTYLETGITVVTLGVSDANGNIYSCNFNLTILASYAFNLACPEQSLISLQNQCSRPLTAQDLLGTGGPPCPGDFAVQRLDENNLPVAPFIGANDVGQPFTGVLTHLITGATCTTEVTVTGGTPTAISCPPEITIFCNEPIDPDYTGWPTQIGCYEDLTLSYEDNTEFTFCSDTVAFQTIRTWFSTDPVGKVDSCSQFITAMRFNPMPVEFPPDYDGTLLPPIQCSDTLGWEEIASPQMTGVPMFQGFPAGDGFNCKIAVNYLDFETQICGAAYEIRRAWKVVKVCPPSFTLLDTQLIRVVDVQAPVFEVPDTIFISLSADCADSLFMPAVNILSECSDYSVIIETPWDTLTTNGGFLYPDSLPGVYPARYIVTDACSNEAVKDLTFVVDDQTLVRCPPNDTISCNLFFDSLNSAIVIGDNLAIASFLGNPTCYSNCEFQFAEVDSFHVNSCGKGYLQRRISNLNAENPFTCIQHINVVHISNFEVLFPGDISICTSPDSTSTGYPLLFYNDCEKITISSIDQVVQSGYPGCYTINRQWKVTNSCIENQNAELPDEEVGERRYKDGGDGIIRYTQVIQVNTSAPEFANGCEMPDLYLSESTCTAQVALSAPAVGGCGNVMLTISGDLGDVAGLPQELGPGVYNVVYLANDSCGNSNTCVTKFEVLDTIYPVAACRSGLIVNITPSGTAELQVQELDAGSLDNCTGLSLSFLPDTLLSSITFTCEDLCVAAHVVALWVSDPSGNQSFCETTVVIQNPGASCASCEVKLSGMVRTEENEMLAGAEVRFWSTGFADTLLIVDGNYEQPVPREGDYTITVYKNSNPLNGVTTFDLVLIQRHILGTLPLNSAYKIIAADINKSGTITTYDLVSLRRLILYIDLQFQNNTSWRFVPADFVFPNPTKPLESPFPESIVVNDVTEDTSGLDFIAIKIGDVNGSASVDPLKPNSDFIIDH